GEPVTRRGRRPRRHAPFADRDHPRRHQRQAAEQGGHLGVSTGDDRDRGEGVVGVSGGGDLLGGDVGGQVGDSQARPGGQPGGQRGDDPGGGGRVVPGVEGREQQHADRPGGGPGPGRPGGGGGPGA